MPAEELTTPSNAPASIYGDFMDTLPTRASVDRIKAHYAILRTVQEEVLKDGHHYMTIPGTKKPCLLKPGAETLCKLYNVYPAYDDPIFTSLPKGHLEVVSKCRLVTMAGQPVGEGLGSCTSMENKYRYVTTKRSCPECGAEAIRKSKFKQDEWFCFDKMGGCGAKFKLDDPRITSQPEIGKKETENPFEYRNTILKMATKRAFIAAVLTTLNVSESYSQDLDDYATLPRDYDNGHAAQPEPKPGTAEIKIDSAAIPKANAQAKAQPQAKTQPKAQSQAKPAAKPPAQTRPATEEEEKAIAMAQAQIEEAERERAMAEAAEQERALAEAAERDKAMAETDRLAQHEKDEEEARNMLAAPLALQIGWPGQNIGPLKQFVSESARKYGRPEAELYSSAVQTDENTARFKEMFHAWCTKNNIPMYG